MSADDTLITDRNVLDLIELRVLGVLAEKEALTPDNYPLTLNALISGCNQLTSRDPVMVVDEEEIRTALDSLTGKRLVAAVNQAGARVPKYEHRLRIQWMLPQEVLAVLTVLSLRGPQTAGEVRSRSGRLYAFSSGVEVESALQFLIDKYPPLVARLERSAGTKESRYAHLLCGDDVDALAGMKSAAAPAASRQDRLGQLEAEVVSLKEEVEALRKELHEFKQQFS